MTDIEKQEKYRACSYIKNWIKLNFEVIYCFAFDIQFFGHRSICVRFKSDVFDKLNNKCQHLNYRYVKYSIFDEYNLYVSLKFVYQE